MKIICIIITGLMVFCSTVCWAGANNCRCGSKIIKAGSTKHETIKHCGQPLTQERLGSAKNGLGIVEVIYEKNDGFDYYILFIGNRVTQIETVRR